ncbi:MAG: prolipoprotein diacylglyceryl transferase [Lachnospiraceae bacterium]|nr:prolipoprotein diacylglyceryl transferase [Lachnospiraceae bacterium]
MMGDIRFPGLGIHLKDVPESFNLFGLEVKLYGFVIAIGFILAYIVATKEAKRTGQDDEIYVDFMLWMIIPAILGARLYYVLFSLDSYIEPGKGFWQTFKDIINIRQGGLAIYGGIIAAVIVAIIFCRKKKVSIKLMADTAAMPLLIGQIVGRFGNFFNREAFGDYTDSFFRMCLPVSYFNGNGSINGLREQGIINEAMVSNPVYFDNAAWISVHPTFLYEALWNLGLLLVIFFYRKNKKFDGELGLLYVWGYGLGRVWIEALRSDSLMVPGINMKVSQLVAAVCVLVASVIIVKKRFDCVKEMASEKETKKK